MPFRKKSYFLEHNSREDSSEQIERYNSSIATDEDTKEGMRDETPQKKGKKRKPFLGLIYTFLIAVDVAAYNVIVKKLFYISPGQLTFVLNAGSFVGILPITVACQGNILGKKKDRIALIGRGILGGTGLYLNVLAFASLPLVDAAIITSIVPAVTVLFARIFLRESCSFTQSLSLIITLCGLFLSIRLPELLKKRNYSKFDQNYIIGYAAAFGTVLTLSLATVLLRKMRTMHFSLPILYFSFFGMIENVIVNSMTVSYSEIACGWDQYLCLFIGILGFAGNIVFTLALQVEEAGIVAVQRASLDIIVATIFQIIFFKDYPDIYNIGGGVLVMLSLTILGIRNWLLSLPENSEHRRKLKYLLI